MPQVGGSYIATYRPDAPEQHFNPDLLYRGGSMSMLVKSYHGDTEVYQLFLDRGQAEKLRRVCNFNLTVKDRVTARSGDRDGWSMYHFMNELGDKLKAAGVRRWKRT